MEFYDLELKLRTYLQSYNIRLCDTPYTINDEIGNEIEVLAERISEELKLDKDEVVKVLIHLRIKSLANIKLIKKFKESNIVTIKVHQPKVLEDVLIEISDFHNATGLVLKQNISEKLNMSLNFIKIIFQGKLILDDALLINQKIKNNCKVILLCMNEIGASCVKEISDFGTSKDMANYLAERAVDGRFSSNSMDVEITNQSGEVLYLTDHQKSLLTYGLTMHHQAVIYINENQFKLALLHCLEADDAFIKSKYCDNIDNAAILQLDIVWCYYCLQNMDEIQEAKKRLNICEDRMKKCYGEGNERIKRIREKTTFEGVPESVNVFRLYLLRGVVAYYENETENSRECLMKAIDVYESFVIPQPLIFQVMELGFSRDQALEGLRVYRDINSCVDFILRRENDKRNLKSKQEETGKRKAIAKRLGYTLDGKRIDLDVLEKLIDRSGMNSKLCLAAIRRSNNNFHEAIELLLNNQPQLMKDIQEQHEKGIVVDGDITYESLKREMYSIKYLKEITNLQKSIVKRILRKCDGDREMALNMLLEDHSLSLEGSSNSSVDEQVKMENLIYEKLGQDSTEKSEERYKNPTLRFEISTFNKFAKLLNIKQLEDNQSMS